MRPKIRPFTRTAAIAAAWMLVLAACHADAPPPAPLGYDGGSTLDGSVTIDAGGPQDAGPAVDAGGPQDAGPLVCPPVLPTPCGGVCKNLQTDRFNCGSCGMACGRGQI